MPAWQPSRLRTCGIALGALVLLFIAGCGVTSRDRGEPPPSSPSQSPRITSPVWPRSTEVLWPATTYRASVTARRGDERIETTTLDIRTTDAPRLNVVLTPGDGDIAGIGMPVIVRFNRTVPARAQAAVAARLRVSATPAVDGRWRWLSPRELHWRPTMFWRPHTKVRVEIDLTGLRVGATLWGGPRHTTA